jgi:hypothetical protein
MKLSPAKRLRPLPVDWKDCAWFPPVLARRRPGGRRPVFWPVQIITDPTVCASRTLDLTQL